MKIIHDSRQEKYRSPTGAQPCKTVIRLFLETDAPSAVVRFWIDGEAYLYSMAPASGGFEYEFSLPEKPGIVWYYFIVGDTYYGNAPDNLGGLGAMAAYEPPSFQITAYAPDFKTPDWLGDGIMMQIMPDRFYRGGNNPCRGRMHENWYEAPWLNIANNGDNTADDFYGGDLKGITEKLPYIKSLGVSVIYMNPIFLSHSNHKYDTSDYMRVDPSFGSEADLTELCERARELGIRVILDGVFSHTGDDSIYFNKYSTYGSGGAYNTKESPYYHWYTFRNWPYEYSCWWGFDTLPNVDKRSGSFRDFIINSEDSVCAHWIRAGASGWRLDVADELPMDFIASFRARMKKENPDSALIGEVWEDPSRKVTYGMLRSYCLGDTLDSVMNYPLREAILDFLCENISAHRCVRLISSLFENMPRPFYRSLMNLLGSHDKPRALTVLANVGNMEPDRQYRYPIKLTEDQYALGRRRLIAAWQMVCALPGMPTIYYGDEAGLYGMSDPFCRAAYPWGREDKFLATTYAKIAGARLADRTLIDGDVRLEALGDDVVVIRRTLAEEKRTLAVNRSKDDMDICGTTVPAQSAAWINE
jgi:cyclomaltodextrinase